MGKINILDKNTIDKIAAGEVVERPFNVVKELTENSIDANAKAITIEIKEGGMSLIRITDDGEGIDKSDIRKAFMSHATSKISNESDLLSIRSLGFRGEALATISAVSDVEVISKTKSSLTGIRYLIEGGNEVLLEDIGAPDGTTFIVKNLFYNTPARKKFLKSSQTEGSYVADLLEHLALSHPEIAIKFIQNGKIVFSTSGNASLKDVIYRIYGMDTVKRLSEINYSDNAIKITGFLGKPDLNRSTRTFENIYINGRYVQCKVITNALEEGYRNFLMQHKFPFCVLHFEIDPSEIDVNVHPSKMEVRLHNQDEIYDIVVKNVQDNLKEKELIPEVSFDNSIKVEPVKFNKVPEPFEKERISIQRKIEPLKINKIDLDSETNIIKSKDTIIKTDIAQLNIFDEEFLTPKAKEHYEILGQIFKTYWLIAFEDKLFIMDQHAAHEKIKYESLISKFKNKTNSLQTISPPYVLELSSKEFDTVFRYIDSFSALGFEIEDFGLSSIAIRSVPLDLYGLSELDFFKEVLDELIDNPLKGSFDVILNKIASMACKSAVKGNTDMNKEQIRALLDELLTLENPYNCPHGRPTIVSMSKYEIEKKFKRVVD